MQTINYPIQCSCGVRITIQVENDHKVLRVYCHRCSKMLLEKIDQQFLQNTLIKQRPSQEIVKREEMSRKAASSVTGKTGELGHIPLDNLPTKKATQPVFITGKTGELGHIPSGNNEEFFDKTVVTQPNVNFRNEANPTKISPANRKMQNHAEEIANLDRTFAADNLPQKNLDQTMVADGSSESETSSKETDKLKKIGKYTISKLLGKGGMGEVYLGTDDETQEKVAIKLLLPSAKSNFVDYFLREAQLLMKLKHNNIVALKGMGNHDGAPFLAMEFVVGENLKDLVASKKFIEAKEAAQIIYYLLDALEYAQKFHFIHRDIKPENILLETDTGMIKLIDLGLAKTLEDGYELSRTGAVMGTVFYMAPEQIRDSKHIDARADIYSVGATLFHLLCGQPPFTEYAKERMKLFEAKVENTFFPLNEKKPDLPKRIVDITHKAMEKDTARRYQSAADMKKDILSFWKTGK